MFTRRCHACTLRDIAVLLIYSNILFIVRYIFLHWRFKQFLGLEYWLVDWPKIRYQKVNVSQQLHWHRAWQSFFRFFIRKNRMWFITLLLQSLGINTLLIQSKHNATHLKKNPMGFSFMCVYQSYELRTYCSLWNHTGENNKSQTINFCVAFFSRNSTYNV